MKDILNTVLSIFEWETLCNIYTDKKTGLKLIPLLEYYFPADGDEENPLR